MKKNIFIFTIFCLLLFFVSCQSEVKEISASLDGEYELEDFSLENFKINVKFSNGLSSQVTLKKEYLSKDDLDKLDTIGTHKVTITYQGVSCEANITIISSTPQIEITFINDDLVTKKYTSVIKEIPIAIEKENYTFIGWFKDNSSLEEDKFSLDKLPVVNTTYYARYELNKYTVTFIGFDNETIEIKTVDAMNNIEMDAPNVEGYTFKYWDKDLTNVSSDLIVKAVYEINKYTVRFFDNKNNILKEEIVEYGKNAINPDPTIEGYDFIDWNIDYTNVKSDLDVYGNYKIKTFTVKFLVNNDIIATYNVEYNKSCDEPSVPTIGGHTFIGWDKDFTNIRTDLEINAIYAINYTVKFYNWDGTFLGECVVASGQDAKSPDVPERSGYKFTGWNESIIAVNSNLEVTARFAPITYRVTFLDNDGNELATKVVRIYEDAVAPTIPSIEGMEFVKWDKDITNVTSTFTTKAIYKRISYQIVFKDSDEIYKEQTILYGERLTSLSVSKEGFEFLGWFTDESLENIFDFTQEIKNNITLFAKWQEKNILVKETLKLLPATLNPLFYGNNINFYNTYSWANYTLERKNNILFLTNVVVIESDSTDLKPSFKASSCGIIYINQTGNDYITTLSKTAATVNTAYKQAIISNNMVSEIITTDADITITIPKDGYLWCPKYNDSLISSSITNGLNVSMRDFTVGEEIYVNDWRSEYTVTFKNMFGTIISEQKVKAGFSAVLPDVVNVDGYKFDRWEGNYQCVTKNEIVIAMMIPEGIEYFEIEIIDGTGTGTYKKDEYITISPNKITNKKFEYWQVNSKIFSKEEVHTFKVTKSMIVTAIYSDFASLTNLMINGSYVKYINQNTIVQIPSAYIENTNQFRAAWVTPLAGDIPSYVNTATYKQNITNMLNVLEKFNFNAVVFHIRIMNDALYISDLNPKSNYLNTNEDLLTWVISECHKRDIEFHAWMNPYRVKSSGVSSLSTLANSIKSKCPANIGSDVNNLLLTKTNNNIGAILNPGLPEVRSFIVDTVMEVMNKYDVDAIHFDDYFYASGINDNSTYGLYNPNNLELYDWRREQVNLFISSLSKTMREYNEKNNRDVQLGISPTGIYRNGNGIVTYDTNGNAITNGSNTGGQEHYQSYLFADTLKWINNEWIDYICPQSYWAFTHTTAGYANVIDWWDKVVENKNVKLYSGIGLYMGASVSGNYSWTTNQYELLNQITYINKLKNVDGFCIYKFDYLNQYNKNQASEFVTKLIKNLFDVALKQKATRP